MRVLINNFTLNPHKESLALARDVEARTPDAECIIGQQVDPPKIVSRMDGSESRKRPKSAYRAQKLAGRILQTEPVVALHGELPSALQAERVKSDFNDKKAAQSFISLLFISRNCIEAEFKLSDIKASLRDELNNIMIRIRTYQSLEDVASSLTGQNKVEANKHLMELKESHLDDMVNDVVRKGYNIIKPIITKLSDTEKGDTPAIEMENLKHQEFIQNFLVAFDFLGEIAPYSRKAIDNLGIRFPRQ